MTQAIPPEQAAKYRRLAELLGPEAGLLDRCEDDRDRSVCHAMADPVYGEMCLYCGGTGKVVPPLEVWMGRLVRALAHAPARVNWHWVFDAEPEFALLASMLAALGEKEAT